MRETIIRDGQSPRRSSSGKGPPFWPVPPVVGATPTQPGIGDGLEIVVRLAEYQCDCVEYQCDWSNTRWLDRPFDGRPLPCASGVEEGHSAGLAPGRGSHRLAADSATFRVTVSRRDNDLSKRTIFDRSGNDLTRCSVTFGSRVLGVL